MRKPIQHADFGKTADDYLTHRAGFPESFFAYLSNWLPVNGQRSIDLGTGTGTLARGLSRLGCHVTGFDISEQMLNAARQLDPNGAIDFQVSAAESMPLAANSVELITAGTCWHWFDRPKAAAECQRVLKSGCPLVIAHYDWLPLQGNVVEATEQLIELFNPNWHGGRGTGVHGQWFRDLGEAEFSDIRSFSYDEPATYTHEAWRGRIRASAGIAASLSQPEVNEFDQALEDLLQKHFPDPVLRVPHRVFAVTGNAK